MSPSFDLEDQLQELEKAPHMVSGTEVQTPSSALEVCGVDEVGTGALAGPVYAGAVWIPANADPAVLRELDDSKKLSPRKRQELAAWIEDTCKWALGRETASRCGRGTMTEVRISVMKMAFQGLKEQFPEGTKLAAIVDGASLAIHIPIQPAIYQDRADSESYSVAAASILAKVVRDAEMIELDKVYPGYGWDANKGYGTRFHLIALRELGKTIQHRDFKSGV